MNDDPLDGLRRLLLQVRVGGDRADHLVDANRLIMAFMQIEDSNDRQTVIESAERLVKKKKA